MAQQRYDVGDSIRVFVQFYNLQGFKAAPTLVRCGVANPLGVIVEADVTADLSTDPETGLAYVGRYYTDVVPDVGSDTVPWWIRFEGTGAVVAAEEQDLWVRVPRVVIPA